jgi:flagellar protein FlaI
MGLLEKAQEKKQKQESMEKIQEKQDLKIKEKSESKGLLAKVKEKKSKTEEEKLEPKGLLKKAQEKRQKQKIVEKTDFSLIKNEQDKAKPEIKIEQKIETLQNTEVIEERTGFGWKGMGTRKIIFDNDSKEYFYVLEEPALNEYETELKKELGHLFKMLADVSITTMTQEEKEKFLEETLHQIIIDNNIKFSGKIKPKKDDKKEKKSLFSKKSKEEKEVKEKKEKKKEPEVKKSKEELEAEEQKSKDKIFYHIFRDFLGYGKIDIIMEDEGIEDISCDGQDVPVFIYHKKYDEITTNVQFEDELELNSFVVRLAQISGKQISIYSPIVDGKLPDGSRLQTTLARTVTKGSTFTIRKFKENPLTPIDLIDYKSLSLEMAAYFWMAIERGSSILFCGGTASGKTTALNALSLFIPGQHKIVSIEDTREVNLPHKNWIAGTTREGFSSSDENKTGKDIDMFDLIRAALRQRPKVVMVGEVRGREAYSLFQAMATGHTSYATVHASDIHTLIQRLENPPISLPRALLTSLDIIVFQNAIDLKGKTVRRMTSVTEIVKLDPDTNQLIFMEPYRWVSKTDDRFESTGTSKILNNIKQQSDWTDEQLEEELENRKLVLSWMLQNNLRDYKEVGRIVNLYSKHPEQLIKKAKEELKT